MGTAPLWTMYLLTLYEQHLTLFFFGFFLLTLSVYLSVMENMSIIGKSHNYSEKERKIMGPCFPVAFYVQYHEGCCIDSWWALLFSELINLDLAGVNPNWKPSVLQKAWCRVTAQGQAAACRQSRQWPSRYRAVQPGGYSCLEVNFF